MKGIMTTMVTFKMTVSMTLFDTDTDTDKNKNKNKNKDNHDDDNNDNDNDNDDDNDANTKRELVFFTQRTSSSYLCTKHTSTNKIKLTVTMTTRTVK